MDNNLQVFNQVETTISSVELVEIINQFRSLEENGSELLHKNFKAKIEKELKILGNLGINNQLNFKPVKYKDKKGEERPCYELNRDGMLMMLNSESTLVRFKTIEYINTLEKQIENKPLASYMIEDPILRAEKWIEEQKEKKQLEQEKQKIEEEKNNLVHTSKTYTSTEIAKELGFSSAVKFNKDLHDKEIQFKKNNTWVLYSKYANKGYVETKQTKLDNGTIIYNTRWTGEGREWLLNTVYVKEIKLLEK